MKYFLFDFDGTLVDSMPTFGQTVKDILDESGVKYGEDIVKIVTPLGYGGCADYCISIGLEGTTETVKNTMIDRMLKKYKTEIPAKESVPEVLKKLKENGCSLNLLTASPHAVFEPCLTRLGIIGLFDNLWSSDDFGTIKKDPEIYRMAAKRLGTTVDEIAFFDDNIGACATAKEAGAYVVGVYDESGIAFEEEMKSTLDRYIYTFSELFCGNEKTV